MYSSSCFPLEFPGYPSPPTNLSFDIACHPTDSAFRNNFASYTAAPVLFHRDSPIRRYPRSTHIAHATMIRHNSPRCPSDVEVRPCRAPRLYVGIDSSPFLRIVDQSCSLAGDSYFRAHSITLIILTPRCNLRDSTSLLGIPSLRRSLVVIIHRAISFPCVRRPAHSIFLAKPKVRIRRDLTILS